MLSSIALRSLGAAVLCTWLAWAPASHALAQTAATADMRDAEARARFDAGRIAFAASRYADALGDFERAYELSGRAELLYNMGTCLDRLRRDDEAIEIFGRYLEALPDAPNRLEVETRLEAMRASRDERREREAALAAAAAPDVAPAPGGGIETEWWLWTLVGVVVVGAGVGIGVGVAASGETTSAPIPGDVGPGGVVMALVSW